MTRTETIHAALKLAPVHWGSQHHVGLPLRYEPGRGVWPWTTRQPDGTGRANLQAEGEVIVRWMREFAELDMETRVFDGGMIVEEVREPITATDRSDWLLTLAEAIVEVMG